MDDYDFWTWVNEIRVRESHPDFVEDAVKRAGSPTQISAFQTYWAPRREKWLKRLEAEAQAERRLWR